MVLVLAALYSLYRNNSDPCSSDGSNDDQQQQQSPLQKLQQGGAAVHQAFLRCSAPPPPMETEKEYDSKLAKNNNNCNGAVDYSRAAKEEWINATFGSGFLKPNCEESGKSVLGTFRQVYQIPASKTKAEKVGITISRLALGVYVKSIQPGSEASYAGVVEDSVLLDINGLPVLAEPSRNLLQRLWQYQTTPLSEPLVLRFIRNSEIYKVIILSDLSGIQFGPAAPRLPLIQRSTNEAKRVGVLKGSLLVAVNGRTFRELDHVNIALHTHDVFSNRQNLILMTALPPVTARSVVPCKQRKKQEFDGVELRFVPLTYAIGSLCIAQPPPELETRDLAELVANCKLQAPLEPPRTKHRYPVPPTLESTELLDAWDSMRELEYLLKLKFWGYDEVAFSETMPNPNRIESLHELSNVGADVVQPFLLQFLSLICDASNESTSELTSMLLKLSRKNEQFCQYLYFLLRSYIATFESTDRDSRNLLALLNCLEMLRFAELRKVESPRKPESPVRRRSRIRRRVTNDKNPLDPTANLNLPCSPSSMYDHMSDFLCELDGICKFIEDSLQKSLRQKITDWAISWSVSYAVLSKMTSDMRQRLNANSMTLINPVESSEILNSLIPDECFILPSAHFPVLLTFNVSERQTPKTVERWYKTRVELVHLTSATPLDCSSLMAQGTIAGSTKLSDKSTKVRHLVDDIGVRHTWNDGVLEFETGSWWGPPQTLTLKFSNSEGSPLGFCWIDLTKETALTTTADVWPMSAATCRFDDHGELPESIYDMAGQMNIQVRVTTQLLDEQNRKRQLLYKHNEDLRQEAFAIQFIKTCDDILKAAGLDLKILTFQCCPVGTRRGFVEWVPNSVPLSEICLPLARILSGSKHGFTGANIRRDLSKFESLRQLDGQPNESLGQFSGGAGSRGSIANNSIQDYLRSVAFDADSPYLIQRHVMDTFVKSCAGYSIITYILGVGDRHLDNLLLHNTGAFFHCDFSFILGQDPKKYLPMRISEDMVYGMGGKESDNYAKFLSLSGAAFLALRRPENVRVLLSMVRLMEFSDLPDISMNQRIEQAILGVRDRLRVDLNEALALKFIEELIEQSQSNRMWIAVDAFHSLGKKF